MRRATRPEGEPRVINPLHTMIIRRAELDELVMLSSVTTRLRRDASPLGGTFGKVRSGGHKLHAGWDLYAAVGTPCFAICGCEFVYTRSHTGYGRTLVMKLIDPAADALARELGAKHLYAIYAHLSAVDAVPASYMAGATLARTGADGNAFNTPPHLHFEIRTVGEAVGSKGTIDPARLFGSGPLSSRFDDERRVSEMFRTP